MRVASNPPASCSDDGLRGPSLLTRPVFFPSRTNHIRMFPTKHAFSYSYLLVGIPVGWKGSTGCMLSVDLQARRDAQKEEHLNRSTRTWPSWFTVEAEHYLNRGDPQAGLAGRLRAYLKTQNVSPEAYPYAYLVTAPRFLGYHFNPVSFWYLYDQAETLKAMIVEVNNTFDERRMYFLECSSPLPDDEGHALGDRPEPDGKRASFDAVTSATCPGASTQLRGSWPKDFHVSPFNSRDGQYSLIAIDPLSRCMNSRGPVNNNLTLRSVQGPVILVASVFSTGEAIDPKTMTAWSMARFLVSWWWVGLVTFPRIVREAGKLFLKRKLGIKLYFRPEIKRQSIAREESPTERIIERYFRDFIQHRVEQSKISLTVTYIPALRYGGKDATATTYSSPGAQIAPTEAKQMEIEVLTPAFYSRFVHSLDVLEAFDSESCRTKEENRTVLISDPAVLKSLFSNDTANLHAGNDSSQRWPWLVLRTLRGRPPAQSYPSEDAREHSLTQADRLRRGVSALDAFVSTNCSAADSQRYRRTLTELFLSEYIAAGSTPLLHAYGAVLGLLLTAYVAHYLSRCWHHSSSC